MVLSKYVLIFLVLGFVYLLSYNDINAKIKITGMVYEWVDTPPFSGTIITYDSTELSGIKKRPLDNAKITIFYGSDFDIIDTTKPKILEPVVYSGKDGSFVFSAKPPENEFRAVINVQKKGYIGKSVRFFYKKENPEIKAYVILVKYVKNK